MAHHYLPPWSNLLCKSQFNYSNAQCLPGILKTPCHYFSLGHTAPAKAAQLIFGTLKHRDTFQNARLMSSSYAKIMWWTWSHDGRITLKQNKDIIFMITSGSPLRTQPGWLQSEEYFSERLTGFKRCRPGATTQVGVVANGSVTESTRGRCRGGNVLLLFQRYVWYSVWLSSGQMQFIFWFEIYEYVL